MPRRKAPMSETAIRIENLTRDFGPVRAVDNLSLEAPAGMIFGFLGPNGAGKTTTIRLLLGLLEPTSGQAEVLGFDIRTHANEVRARTGALLEHLGLYELMSVEDNLEFYGRVFQMPDKERQARIKELLTQIGLWERRKERVETWSRGMRQKLALARALLHRPQLMLLDEPTAGLDVMAAVAMRDYLVSLAEREGVTIFLTTHNMAEAEKLCPRVAVISKGKLLAVGHPGELRAQTGARIEVLGRGFNEDILSLLRAQSEVRAAEMHNERLEIDLCMEADTAPLVNMLVGVGVQVQEVRRCKVSLEEVFLTLMEEEQ
ncbi:MAG: ABC transporter ATP-binding protein [Bacteroidota bacterium]